MYVISFPPTQVAWPILAGGALCMLFLLPPSAFPKGNQPRRARRFAFLQPDFSVLPPLLRSVPLSPLFSNDRIVTSPVFRALYFRAPFSLGCKGNPVALMKCSFSPFYPVGLFFVGFYQIPALLLIRSRPFEVKCRRPFVSCLKSVLGYPHTAILS